MKKRVILFILFFTLILEGAVFKSYAEEVPFTLEDRDRLIRVEEGLKSTNQRIDDLNRRLDEGLKSVNQRIDDLRALILWGFGILFGGMGLLMGFVIWDRRTALAPAIKKTRELDESKEKIERVLKELASKDPKVAEALKIAGLL